MNRIILGPEYFPTSTIGRPISNAQIFVGEPDTDPEVVINQKQISVQQEDGTIVAVSQPILTGIGGIPLYLGSPVTVLVDGNYALKVLDSGGSQIYYVPSQAGLIVINKVDDIKGLIDITGQSDGDSADVFGFFFVAPESNPKGGGQFVWQDGINKTTANGGTIIDPDNIGGFDGTWSTLAAFLTAQGGGSGTGCWIRLYDQSINPMWFGAMGDGVVDDTTAIQAAFSSDGLSVYLPVGNFKTISTLTLPVSKTLFGVGTICTTSGAALTAASGNNKISGVKFDGTNAAAPYWGVFVDSASEVVLEKVSFVRQRIMARNNDAKVVQDIIVKNCFFDVDFTGTTYEVDQYDVFSAYGTENVKFINNTVRVTNVHRVLKISDNPDEYLAPQLSPYTSQNVLISGNTITGSTTSNKQVLDCFVGAGEVIFTDNHVDVSGFSVIYDDKSENNAPVGGENPSKRSIISSNILRTDSVIIVFQGSYGITEAGYDGSRESKIVVSDNIFNSSSSSIDLPVSIRFSENVIFNNNILTVTRAALRAGLTFLSNKHVTVHGNHIDGGIINISKATTNHSGFTFSGDFDDLLLSNNVISNFDDNAGITLISLSTATGVVRIVNNLIRPGDGSHTRRAYYVLDCTFKHLEVKDNQYRTDFGTSATPIVSGSSITKNDTVWNSWEQRIDHSSAAPTAETWMRGDVVINTSASVGQPMGWICIVAGTPGTWGVLANIA